MNLFSRSALVASVAAAGLLAVSAVPGNGAMSCPFSKFDAPQATASGDPPGGWWASSPDSNALGAALGGLGAIAALLTGGTVLLRQRLASATASEASPEAEADWSPATETETVLVSEPAEIESEVALAYRR